jgi:hypothetical protein
MKINLGAGATRYPDFVNCDYDTKFNPEYVFDIEKDIWPFEDNSVTHVIAHHVLEHLGEGYFHALKEMYRVCKPAAHIDIHVPHFRHSNQFHDPTHRRPITPTGLLLFSKEFNDNNPHPGSKLGYHFDVDFKILSSRDILDQGNPHFQYIQTLSPGELEVYAHDRNNVFSETHIEIQVVKL